MPKTNGFDEPWKRHRRFYDAAIWSCQTRQCTLLEAAMNNLIYLVGLVVVILAILAFLGLR